MKFGKIFLILTFIFHFSSFAQHFKIAKTIDGFDSGISKLFLDETRGVLIAGDNAGNLTLYSSDSAILLSQTKAHSSAIHSISFNSTGKLMLTASSDELKIWNVGELKLLHSYRDTNLTGIGFASFSIADGFIYFSSGSKLYTSRSDFKKEIQKLVDFTDSITAGVITNDRSALILATGKTLRVVNTRTDNIIQEIAINNSNVERLALLSENRLASWNADGTVSIWSLNLGLIAETPLLRFKAGVSSPMSFSHDGKYMVSGNIGSWARIWNWNDRKIDQELFGHTSTVSCFVFSEDDKFLFTGSADKKIKVWSKEPIELASISIEVKKESSVSDTTSKPVPSQVVFDSKNIPLQLYNRSITQTESYEVTESSIEIEVFDNLILDEDTISLNFNGEWILKNYGVTREKKTITLKLKENSNNSLILFAENMGKSPPNTAAIEFTLGGKKKLLRLKSDMKTCSAVNFFYRPIESK